MRELRAKIREGWRAYAAANSVASAEGEVDGARQKHAWHDIVDSEEFLGMARRLQEMHPEYRADVEALAEEVAGDDESTAVTVVKEAAADLKSTLELILVPENIAQERQTRRQIKNYVFFLRAAALRRLGPMAHGRVTLADAGAALDGGPLLSWQGQSALLDHALSAFSAAAGSRGGPEHDRRESVCTRDSPEILREAMASMSSMQS